MIWPRRLTAATLVAALIPPVVLSSPGATAAGTPQVPPVPERTVTLITGDKVAVRPDGKGWQVRVEPGPGRTTSFFRTAGPQGVTVLPADVVPLVRSGRLDRALFDVTGLLAQGLGDHDTRTLPLLVQTDGRRAANVFGQVERLLPKARLTAVATRKGTVIDTLPAGTRRVWLNGRAKPTLDMSVPQVGAPAAWQAGYTGKAAKLAILDTGYDPAHPDLAGAVAASQDFTGEGIRDADGHGTHVASIAAGRGTASNGKYTGVAKDAGLLIGKVCGLDGCPFDAVLAGMQWAVDNGARIVNLSLGGGPTDGTDPLSTELNRLGTASGALFVVAAGNSGPHGRVSAPAAADQALAVGSVTKQDEQSDFSSVGPRTGDSALKPDLTAPGSDIVAARAAGTGDESAVDEHYARLSGTSMAAPHVTGAAAILAAQHPDWPGARLKAVLMSSAKPLDGLSVYQQGTGRLNISRAYRQQVITDPGALQFGLLTWPHDNRVPITKQLTYRNLGSTPATLALRLDIRDQQGNPAPAGLFTAGADSVTIPAGGEATVPITLDPKAMASGIFGGHVVAATQDGSSVVQSSVGVELEEESYTFGYQAIDRTGAPVEPGEDSRTQGVVLGLDRNIRHYEVAPGEKVRLPRGRYAVLVNVSSSSPEWATESLTAFAESQLNLDADRRLTIDARRGIPARFDVDRPSVPDPSSTMDLDILASDGTPIGGLGMQWHDRRRFVIPQERAADNFRLAFRPQLRQAEAELTDSGGHRVPVDWIAVRSRFTGTKRLRTVDVGHARSEEVDAADVKGKLALFTLDVAELPDYLARIQHLMSKGAAASLLYLTNKNVGLPFDAPESPALFAEGPEVQRLVADAGSTVTVTGRATSPYFYQLAAIFPGRIPATLHQRFRDRDLAAADTTFHGTPGTEGKAVATAYLGGHTVESISVTRRLPLPLRQTVLSTAGQVSWGEEFLDQRGLFSSPATTREVGASIAHWAAAPAAPAPAGQAVRTGDQASITLELADPDGHLQTPYDVLFDGSVVLRHGDTELGRTTSPDETLSVKLPAAETEYRLNWSVRPKDRPGSTIASEWTFRSGRPGAAEVLPLVTVGFRPPVRPDNTAPGGRAVRIPVEARRRPGAEGAARLESVEYSIDDGRNWRPAPIQDGAATVQHPSGGWLSLRATATDVQGNKVKETLIRAYEIR